MTDPLAELIHFPILSRADFVIFRLLGPGLGNLLFPVYRAYQAHREFGGTLVFPQFMQLKVGPWLRRERDARSYGDIFLKRNLTEVRQHIHALVLSAARDRSRLRTYEGLGNYFHDLNPKFKSDFIGFLTHRYARQDMLNQESSKITPNDICVHIRRGDFQPAGAGGNGGMNYQVDDDWYIQATKVARSKSPTGRVMIFTDAESTSEKIINGIMPDEIDTAPDALQSMIKMSKHGQIVASKSSFSLWAAYLGSGSAIIHHDFDIHRYMPESTTEVIRV